MATSDFPARRLVIVGGFAAVIAVAPTLAVFAVPSRMIDTPMAACPHGEREDPFTDVCVPELVPNAVADPGPGEQWLEQDVYDTPGLTVPHVGGTTVP
jgi:hypothetical protein